MHGHTQLSQNHWQNKDAKLFKRALSTKSEVNSSTRDSRTTATSKTLKNTYITNIRGEILQKTQQRLKKYIPRSSHTKTTRCKKYTQTLEKRPSNESKANIVKRNTTKSQERRRIGNRSLKHPLYTQKTLLLHTRIKTPPERPRQPNKKRNTDTMII